MNHHAHRERRRRMARKLPTKVTGAQWRRYRKAVTEFARAAIDAANAMTRWTR